MWTTDGMLAALPWLCALLSALGLVPLMLALLSVAPLVPASRGLRGQRRTEARKRVAVRTLEPLLLRAAALCRPWLPERARQAAWQLLTSASHPLGMSPEELTAASLAAMLVSPLVASAAGASAGGVAAALGFGAVLPTLRLMEAGRLRARALERGLPAAMDVCVLCMGAGADFPAALRSAVRELEHVHPVCAEELAMVLEELELGRTRVAALQQLAARTASAAVRDFVAAVCQSEEKGTPVVEALTLQASALRQKRSVLAEELAAKTAVRLTVPLMMTLACIMLILFGPFIVRGGL